MLSASEVEAPQRWPAPARSTAKEQGQKLAAEDALRSVGTDRGPFNWALLEPSKLQLHNAGRGGLAEMKEWLPDDKVMFGVLRLSFAPRAHNSCARTSPGITKHVLIHWVGPGVSAVQRGIWNAQLQQAAQLANRWCAVSFRREARGLKELLLEDLIAELRRLTTIDSIASADGAAASRLTVESYLSALMAEMREQQEPGTVPGAAETFKVDLTRAVQAVRTPSGTWNWVLLGLPRQVDSSVPRHADSPLPPFPRDGGAQRRPFCHTQSW